MTRLFAILILLLFSCRSNDKTFGQESSEFKYPVLIHQTKFDSLWNWKEDGISEIFPKFVGQYKFSDTVNFDVEAQIRDVDYNQRNWEHDIYAFDTLSSDGLQIYTDYDKTIISKRTYDYRTIKGSSYFPVYIANTTKEPKIFIAKDDYVLAIQEALDTSNYGRWYAIEARGSDFCGNGYFRRKLMPKEFIVFLMPKYSGTDTTYFRTRIQNGESILVSKPYKGVFNKRQFTVTKENSWADDLKNLDYKWMFYGAKNKE